MTLAASAAWRRRVISSCWLASRARAWAWKAVRLLIVVADWARRSFSWVTSSLSRVI
jgi:hypothetical protein